jgi:hypothetical protein
MNRGSTPDFGLPTSDYLLLIPFIYFEPQTHD